MEPTSRTQIDKLGSRLAADGLNVLNEAQYQAFRTGYADALAEVTEALVCCQHSALADRRTEVGSRIKAIDSVVAKLRRKETSLAKMQDIAGCRLTVPTMTDLRVAVGWLREHLTIEREKDYTRKGQKGGYRAVHLIVLTESGRFAEIQSRTEVQHTWANLSEKLAYSIDRLIKAGGGPSDVRHKLVLLSHRGWLVDSLLEHFRVTRELVEDLSDPAQQDFDDLQANPVWGTLSESVADFSLSLAVTERLCERVKEAFITLLAALQPVEERGER